MSHEQLKAEVCDLNKKIVQAGLVTLTWGNASTVDRQSGVMAIKPSGIDYDSLAPDDIVVLSIESGEVIAGKLNASSDTPTHLYLYQKFASIGGIVHTHSRFATSWAQAERQIPCLGTTHADHFYGEIPVVRALTAREIEEDYEKNTGVAIVDTFNERELDPEHIPAALIPGHAPFVWGRTAQAALENAIALEESAHMAWVTLQLNPQAGLSLELLNKHFQRKHGPGAYYGQNKK